MTATERAAALVRAEVRALSPYHVPPADGLVKLDSMENPYRWPEEMRAAWLAELATVEVNRYPDAAASALRERLAEVVGVPPGCELVLGNGSDELIQLLALALAREDAVMMAADPSFVMYRHAAIAAGMDYRGIALDEDDFSLVRDVLVATIEHHRPSLVFLARPNNPTGNLFDETLLREAVERAPGLVVIDEAYEPFAGVTLLDWAVEYPNVVVMRTLSKLGLAGLRLGYLVGARAWTSELEKLRMPYNVNVLTQASVRFALEHGEVFAEQTALIRAERERLHAELAALDGVRVWPSAANFLLVRTLARPAAEVFAALLEAGVLVKNLDGAHPALSDCLRITVGLPEENELLAAALGGAL